MMKYNLIRQDISMLKNVVRSLYELDLDKSTVVEIVMVGQAIDSLNQSIELLIDLREQIK